jgi:hypothetical protein
MEKTIIAVYGRQNEGKSDTIKRVCRTILAHYPKAVPSEVPTYEGDIFMHIELLGIKIGFSSKGDPPEVATSYNEVWKLAETGCQIIICATRTRGATTYKIDDIANREQFDYHTLWMSSYYAPTLNQSVVNQMVAENIIEVIKGLIVGRL